MVERQTYCMPSLDFSLPPKEQKLSPLRMCGVAGCFKPAIFKYAKSSGRIVCSEHDHRATAQQGR